MGELKVGTPEPKVKCHPDVGLAIYMKSFHYYWIGQKCQVLLDSDVLKQHQN